ncbi:rhamnogalacturonan acetylesterase [Robertkochia solimangrovi]|uniref:rhamnogalacturonan acetylesterase n=1 Tax=Robertkochia solimangrovi TaxID=2213046 RepID=UPI00117DE345|nr:rhamnogalacturonan acetylesterase [Robertkochia solimangrovi]TRZ45421.1 rhamnogalacturonan acetylesterase [Robertkochia solimangrovi]
MKRTVALVVVISVFFIQCRNSEEVKLLPTVYTVGDSTVKNGHGDGAGGLWGWGDFIGQFLDTTKVHVENHALGGTSSRTFIQKGLWNPVRDSLKPGDYVLIQFGHNDDGPINDDFRARGTIKGIGEESEEIDNMLTGEHEIVHTYGWYIRKIIRETLDNGGIPIVMSPIPRNKWENGKVPRNNESYGLWAKKIAEQEGALFIDLNDKMANRMEAIGEKDIYGKLFYHKDHTHTSAGGAIVAATIIAESVKQSDSSLKKYLLEEPEIVYPKKTRIFLTGDSTVARNGDSLAVGWGVALPKYVDTFRLQVINRARGGRSTRTYFNEGLWKGVADSLKKGDYVFIQFGHNDGGYIDKPKYRGSIQGVSDSTIVVTKEDGTEEEVHSYGWYMKTFIREAKDKGAIPVVFSHIPRNEWENGHVERADQSYGKWAKLAAEEAGACFIDLNDSIAVAYEKIGPEKIANFFPKDHTHTDGMGAIFNAGIVAACIKQDTELELAKFVTSDNQIRKIQESTLEN